MCFGSTCQKSPILSIRGLTWWMRFLIIFIFLPENRDLTPMERSTAQREACRAAACHGGTSRVVPLVMSMLAEVVFRWRFLFVYFDGSVEVEVFVKEFVGVNLDLYKTFWVRPQLEKRNCLFNNMFCKSKLIKQYCSFVLCKRNQCNTLSTICRLGQIFPIKFKDLALLHNSDQVLVLGGGLVGCMLLSFYHPEDK